MNSAACADHFDEVPAQLGQLDFDAGGLVFLHVVGFDDHDAADGFGGDGRG